MSAYRFASIEPLESDAGLERLAQRLLVALRELREDQAYRGGAASLALLDQAIRDRLAVSNARFGESAHRNLPALLPSAARRDGWSSGRSPVREAADLVDRLIDALGGVPDPDQLLMPKPFYDHQPRQQPI